MSNDAVIAVHGLVKSFGSTRALDGLDLVVERGETHGFLGPNGAGKTTTLRILLGMLRSDAGSAALLGGDPWKDGVALHARLAYVPGDVSLWPNLTGGETIDILGRMRGVEEHRPQDRSIRRGGRSVSTGPAVGVAGAAGAHDHRRPQHRLRGQRVHTDAAHETRQTRHDSAQRVRRGKYSVDFL